MKFKGIKKVLQGKYITRYDISYTTENGREKNYEVVSRDSNLDEKNDISGDKADAVVMIMHNEAKDRILLNFEFRMSINRWVYNFPAGLIDEGEDVDEAATRELKEETGLDLVEITEVWKESYSAVGFSNEKVVVIVGKAKGNLLPSDSDMEEIKAAWYTKKQVANMLETESFAARTQVYCKLWSKE